MYYAVINDTSQCANGHVRDVKDYLVTVLTQLTAGRNLYVLATEAGLNPQTGSWRVLRSKAILVSLQSHMGISQLDDSQIRLTM